MEKQRRILHSSRFANVSKLCSSVETPCLGRTDTTIQTQLRHRRPCGPDLKAAPNPSIKRWVNGYTCLCLKLK